MQLILPGEYRRIALRRRPAGAILSGPSAPETYGESPKARPGSSGTSSAGAHERQVRDARGPPAPSPIRGQRYPSTDHHSAGSHRRMDAKQVWRAALGELQVSLSPANFETWLRDTQLVDVDEQRFRIAVPERLRQGLARVALSLADQPDPRPDRRLQRPGRVRHRHRAGGGAGRPSRRRPARRRQRPPAAARVRRRRSGSSRPGSAARAGRPTSTRATRSRTSSSGRPTGSPTRPACRSRSARAMPTTRSSCTAGWASARPT